VPRSKYTKVPGLSRPLKQITLRAFQFDNIARRELIGLLPLHFHRLGVPADIKQDAAESYGAPKLETMADLIVAYTEKLIEAYLTEVGLGDRTPTNPANVKAAMRKLRIALEPFVRGGIDEQTSSIISDGLDERLADREHEVGKLRLAPNERRRRDLLCQHIGVVMTMLASANQVTFETPKMLEFIATALDHAGIKHSYSKENPSRFATRVFPKVKDQT
jgi:hypothetical protein